ncbi:SDR family NAD(P)-dependent oxidoreductase [Rhodobiaceae bacterium]|nr:SDR family NAD(P)-dependent oxidoreductase [Rhodobiaceae bacterium]
MPNKIALITGVGPGTGSSLSRCFHAEGYKVAMLARNNERLKSLEKELPGSKGFICTCCMSTCRACKKDN